MLRCSKLDTFLACASSAAPTDVPHNPQSEAATEGRTSHEALRNVPACTEPDFEDIAARSGVDADELRRIVAQGKRIWGEVRQWFPNPETEVRFDGEHLCGTSDLVSVVHDDFAAETTDLSILDWKSGWSQREHPSQLTGYAECARRRHGMPTSGFILGVEAWVRHGSYRIHRFTAEILDGFVARLAEQSKLIGRQYGPGDHCLFCAHVHHCVAREEYVRSTCNALALIPAQGITRDRIGALYERSKALNAALRQYDKLLDAELDNGPLALPDGRQIVRREQEVTEIDALKAWPVLLTGVHPLTGDQLSDVVSVSKTAVEAAVKSQAVKGKGASYVRETLAELREAGALGTRVRHVKAIVTPGDADEDQTNKAA